MPSRCSGTPTASTNRRRGRSVWSACRFVNRQLAGPPEMVAAAKVDNEQGLTTDSRALARARSEGWARVWAGQGTAGAAQEAVFVLGEALPPALTVEDLVPPRRDSGKEPRQSTASIGDKCGSCRKGALRCLSRLLRAYEAQASLAEIIMRCCPRRAGAIAPSDCSGPFSGSGPMPGSPP